MFQASNIGAALFSLTQQRVLGLLYGAPQRSYYLNEIVRLAGVGKGTVVRELEKLSMVGLLTVSRQGNQNHYQANADCPVFHELAGLVRKTFGVADVLKAALLPLAPKIERALIYGSIAKGTEHADSDIDLLLVGDDLAYVDVMALLAPVEAKLERPVNPTLYTPEEFAERVKREQPFVQGVMEQPVLWLFGEIDKQQ